jgi:monoamine oxidase
VIREQRATFACRPGIVRPACATAHPRVLLAGDYTWAAYPATLEGAVRSGRRAAGLLRQSGYNPPR